MTIARHSRRGHPAFHAFAAAAAACASVLAACGDGGRRANDAESKVLDLGGTRLSPAQVASHLRRAGFPEESIGRMVCIAKYESSFYTGATNTNSNGTVDYGLFQINGYYWSAACGASGGALLDPGVNTRCALRVLREQGYTAWYGYQYHRAECDAARAPGGDGSGGGAGGTTIAKTPNKLYSGASRQAAFCSDMPVGTAVTVHSSHGDFHYVSVPSGVCKDWQGRIRTEGFIESSVVR